MGRDIIEARQVQARRRMKRGRKREAEFLVDSYNPTHTRIDLPLELYFRTKSILCNTLFSTKSMQNYYILDIELETVVFMIRRPHVWRS